ncbi:MAG: TetR/AcrR family transcriptional regulator [Novosphingobium sp.]|uniref:TetR/AcrR family transcriptional regulator n=1 Tax=Novosphingobium sp. TaxID=1874826 RepID=UPI003B9CDB8C
MKKRRTQEERTAETRAALLNATVSAIHELGYAAVTTAIISERAGVSRGAFLHHFHTRAELMAAVVRMVFDDEMMRYEEIVQAPEMDRLFEWPRILWSVLSRPAGIAVLEILQAARSDPDLAQMVGPTQKAAEEGALAKMREAYGGDEETARSVKRLMVWAVRGLTLSDMIVPDRQATLGAVNLLANLLKAAAPDGSVAPLKPFTM